MPNTDFSSPINVSLRTDAAREALAALIKVTQETNQAIGTMGKTVDTQVNLMTSSFARLPVVALEAKVGIERAINSINFSGAFGQIAALRAQLATLGATTPVGAAAGTPQYSRTVALARQELAKMPPQVQRLVADIIPSGPQYGGGYADLQTGVVGITPRNMMAQRGRTISQSTWHEASHLLMTPAIGSPEAQSGFFQRSGLQNPYLQEEYRRELNKLVQQMKIPINDITGKEKASEALSQMLKSRNMPSPLRNMIDILGQGQSESDIYKDVFGIGRRLGFGSTPAPKLPRSRVPKMLSEGELEALGEQWFIKRYGSLPTTGTVIGEYVGKGTGRRYVSGYKGIKAPTKEDIEAGVPVYPVTSAKVRYSLSGEQKSFSERTRAGWAPGEMFDPGVLAKEARWKDLEGRYRANLRGFRTKDITWEGSTQQAEMSRMWTGKTGLPTKEIEQSWDRHGKVLKNLTHLYDEQGRVVTTLGQKTEGAVGRMNSFTRHLAFFMQGTLIYMTMGMAIQGVIGNMGKLVNVMSQLEVAQAKVGFVMGGGPEAASYLPGASLAIGSRTGISPVEIAGGWDNVASATKNVVEQYQIMDASAKMSLATGLKMEEVQGRVISAVRQGNMAFSDLPKVLDMIAAASQQANVPMKELLELFSEAGALADVFGIGPEQFAIMVGKTVEATSKSADEIKSMYAMLGQRVYQPEQSRKIFEGSGVGVFEVGSYGEARRSIMSILTEIGEKWDDLSHTQQQKTVEALTGVRNANYANMRIVFDNWPTMFAAINNIGEASAGKFESIFGNLTDTFDFKTRQMGASWERFLSTLGNTSTAKSAIDILTASIDAMAETTQRINAKQSPIERTADYLGPLAVGLGVFSKAPIPNPWLRAGAAIATTVGAYAGIGATSPSQTDQIKEAQQQIKNTEAQLRVQAGATDVYAIGRRGGLENTLREQQERLRSLQVGGTATLFTKMGQMEDIRSQMTLEQQRYDAAKVAKEQGEAVSYILSAFEPRMQDMRTAQEKLRNEIFDMIDGAITSLDPASAMAIRQDVTDLTVRSVAAGAKDIALSPKGEGGPVPPKWLDISSVGLSRFSEVETLADKIIEYNSRVFGQKAPEDLTTVMLTDQGRWQIAQVRSAEALTQAMSMLNQTMQRVNTSFVSRGVMDFSGQIEGLARTMQGIINKLNPDDAAKAAKEQSFWIDDQMRARMISGISSEAISIAQSIIGPLIQKFSEPNLTSAKDLTPSQMSRLLPLAQSWMQKIAQFYPGYIEEHANDPVILVDKLGNIFAQFGISQDALRMAMEELTDVNKGMLRGFYNLPAGYKPPTPWDFYKNNPTASLGPINYPWLQQGQGGGGWLTGPQFQDKIKEILEGAKKKAEELKVQVDAGKFPGAVDSFGSYVEEFGSWVKGMAPSTAPDGSPDWPDWIKTAPEDMVKELFPNPSVLDFGNQAPFNAEGWQRIASVLEGWQRIASVLNPTVQQTIPSWLQDMPPMPGTRLSFPSDDTSQNPEGFYTLGQIVNGVGNALQGLLGLIGQGASKFFGLDKIPPVGTAYAGELESPLPSQPTVSTYTQSTAAAAEMNASVMGAYAPYASIIQQAAQQNRISEELLLAVLQAENSTAYLYAKSPAGALGLGQLMPETADYLGVTNPYDPTQSIMGAAQYLAEQLKLFGGDVRLALAAYNAGPGAVMKYGGVPPYDETQLYIAKVMDILRGNGDIQTLTNASQMDTRIPDALDAIYNRLLSMDTAPWAIIQTASLMEQAVGLLAQIAANTAGGAGGTTTYSSLSQSASASGVYAGSV